MSCPLCRADLNRVGHQLVYSRKVTPALNNVVYENQAKARKAASGELNVIACKACGFAFNRSFNPAHILYTPAYDNRRTHSAVYRRHQMATAKKLAGLLAPRDRILEVGCGDGAFLKAISRINGCEAVGVDPVYAESPLRQGRVTFTGSIDNLHRREPFSLVIFQHVLEHIPEPSMLLKKIVSRYTKPGTRLYVEVPDLAWIMRCGSFFDFTFEHVNYFTRHTLEQTAADAYIVVEKIYSAYGGQYLCMIGTAGGRIDRIREDETQPYDLFPLQRRKDELLSAVHQAGKIYIWGASGKGAIFLCDLKKELGHRLVEAIDINPEKQGKFLPISGVEIHPPEQLAKESDYHLFIMNPIYKGEILEMLSDMTIILPNHRYRVC